MGIDELRRDWRESGLQWAKVRVLRKHCFRRASNEANEKSDQRGTKRIRSNRRKRGQKW